jgi:hypothetical protein
MKRFGPGRIWLAAAGVAMGMLISSSAPASVLSRGFRSDDGTAAAPACGAATDGDLPSSLPANYGYRYCGYHWASWPITFTVDPVPPGLDNIKINSAEFKAAAMAAADAWNKAWPGPRKPFVYNASSPNHVRFASLATGKVGSYSMLFAAPKVYNQATITLNQNLKWKSASLEEQVYGERYTWGLCVSPLQGACDWYDAQNALTHEFGHVLGLEHPDEDCTVPSANMTVTMFACAFKTETDKRSLDPADVLGLWRVAELYG